MLYRLYLGGDNRKGGARFPESDVAAVVAQQHSGFTLYRAVGYWEGRPEETWIIEIAADKGRVYATAEILRARFNQDAVAVVTVGAFELVEG